MPDTPMSREQVTTLQRYGQTLDAVLETAVLVPNAPGYALAATRRDLDHLERIATFLRELRPTDAAVRR